MSGKRSAPAMPRMPASIRVLLLCASFAVATVSGTALAVTGNVDVQASGKPVEGATVSFKDLQTGQETEVETDSAGKATVDIPAGSYEVTVVQPPRRAGKQQDTAQQDTAQQDTGQEDTAQEDTAQQPVVLERRTVQVEEDDEGFSLSFAVSLTGGTPGPGGPSEPPSTGALPAGEPQVANSAVPAKPGNFFVRGNGEGQGIDRPTIRSYAGIELAPQMFRFELVDTDEDTAGPGVNASGGFVLPDAPLGDKAWLDFDFGWNGADQNFDVPSSVAIGGQRIGVLSPGSAGFAINNVTNIDQNMIASEFDSLGLSLGARSEWEVDDRTSLHLGLGGRYGKLDITDQVSFRVNAPGVTQNFFRTDDLSSHYYGPELTLGWHRFLWNCGKFDLSVGGQLNVAALRVHSEAKSVLRLSGTLNQTDVGHFNKTTWEPRVGYDLYARATHGSVSLEVGGRVDYFGGYPELELDEVQANHRLSHSGGLAYGGFGRVVFALGQPSY